jgi:chromosome segregation protein
MLKSLELFGFKSFADRTRFDFADRITCVVGPNGSGKSNVVDAIKWILGDQSAKSLRGKDMLDVIFNGSAGRKPSGFAEATLTFDNSGGLLPIDSQEVQVGRRLWRSGDSEYLINRGTARLRDVRDLFLGTGSSAYSIIEQGRVAQILNANAASRRLVFEEAAGISRYKSRKVDAQRKLERVAQNLLRLTDIVDEVEVQLNSTRSQAAKAAKYREISTELREVWLGLAADDYRHLSARLDHIAEAIRHCEQARKELNEQQQGLEGRLAEFDREIAAIDDRLRVVERESAASRERLAGHQSTIQHQTERQNELETELSRLRTQQLLMDRRAREVSAELRQLEVQLRDSRRQYADSQQALEQRERQVEQLSAELQSARGAVEQDRSRLLELMRQVASAAQVVSRVQSQLDALKETARKRTVQRGELCVQIEECQLEWNRRQAEVNAMRTRVAELDAKLANIRKQRQSLLGEHGQFQRTLAEQRECRSAWQARIGLLEDLERRQEGLGIGTKEILSRAKTSHYPPWNRILGSVADLFDVDLENAALLEVALGSRAQLIVLDDYEPLIAYLRQDSSRISGQVGFLAPPRADTPPTRSDNSLDDAAHRAGEPAEHDQSDGRAFEHFRLDPTALPDLQGQPGVLNRADRLVRTAEECAGLAEHLLADTWIVETLDVALDLAATDGKGCRFVTLQGERLDADGSLYVGMVRSETALVSRKSELRRLKNDLLRLDRRIADEEARLSKLGDSLTHVDGDLAEAADEFQQAADELAERKSELAGQGRELQRRQQERELADSDLARLAEEERKLVGELKAAQMQAAQADDDVHNVQQRIEEAERETSRLAHRLQGLQQKQTVENLELAKHQERLTSVQETYERLEAELQQRVQQQDEAERRLETASAKRRRTVLQILNTSAVLAELFLSEERSAARVAALAAEKNQVRQQRARLLSEEGEIRQERRRIDERFHQCEMEDRDLRHQVATLSARIEEEYQVALTDIVESGLSAFRTYLEQRQPKPAVPKAEEAMQSSADADADFLESADNDARTVADDAPTSDVYGEAESAADSGASGNPQPVQEDVREEDLQAAAASDGIGDSAIRFEDVRHEIETRVNRLRRKLKMMGSINTDSLRDLDELEHRHGYLKTQLQDLVEAKSSLEDIVRKINVESKRVFTEKFQAIRTHFQDLFRKLFGGGEGDIVLEDPDDVLECGIDIIARPPGKELRSISLLSGGEKTLTAVALVLAIFKTQPSPFCVLDEVDAALDDANIDRYASVLKEFEDMTQFIVISHRKRTMTSADVLYGVTMEQSGVSKRISLRFDDVTEDGHWKEDGASVKAEPKTPDPPEKAGDVNDAA